MLELHLMVTYDLSVPEISTGLFWDKSFCRWYSPEMAIAIYSGYTVYCNRSLKEGFARISSLPSSRETRFSSEPHKVSLRLGGSLSTPHFPGKHCKYTILKNQYHCGMSFCV